MTTMIDKGIDPHRAVSDAPFVVYQQTIPRHLVHRAAVSEVFITDVYAPTEHRFHVGAQWPRAHSFFGPKTRLHDPLLLVETIRQATLAIAHQVFEVPQEVCFVLQDISFDISEQGLRVDDRPTNLLLTAVPQDVIRRGSGIAGMTIEFDCVRDVERVGGGTIRWRCVSPQSYARLRGRWFGAQPVDAPLPSPVPPFLVGRYLDSDVVLCKSPLDNEWLLRVDPGHPVMFDHEVDHVPGMMIMEAARQAAQLVTGRADAVPLAGRFSFAHYVEFDEPCVAAADVRYGDPHGGPTAHMTFTQGERIAATASLDLLPRR